MTDITTAKAEATEKTGGRRALKVFVITITALAGVFYLGGGFYFSNLLIADAFGISPSVPVYDHTVGSLEGSTIALQVGAEEDRELISPGVWGVDWQDGYGHLGDIVSTSETTVVRELSLISGSQPASGQAANVESWAYPGPDALGIDHKDVIFQSPLGDLDAWLFSQPDSSTWAIHVHGKGATRREALRNVPAFSEAGVTSLVIEYRNDESAPRDPSGIYQYGLTEWEDLEAAIGYARANGAEDVILVGYSTGAGVTMSFLENSEAASHVKAIVFDAPNIDVGATINHVATFRSLPFVGLPIPQSLINVAKWITGIRIGIDWNDINYLNRPESIQVPTLVLHGTADRTVPVSTTERLAESVDGARSHITAGAEHVRSWNTDRAGYEAAVNAFLEGLD